MYAHDNNNLKLTYVQVISNCLYRFNIKVLFQKCHKSEYKITVECYLRKKKRNNLLSNKEKKNHLRKKCYFLNNLGKALDNFTFHLLSLH